MMEGAKEEGHKLKDFGTITFLQVSNPGPPVSPWR
jgi:hypothetical protein